MGTLIIAEAGVNHNGSVARAKDLIYAAKDSGSDIVKFQTFEASKLVTSKVPRAQYQSQNTGNSDNQHSLLAALELSREDTAALARLSRDIGIEFLSTAFDLDSLRFLLDEIGISRIKIPSGEIDNGPYLLMAARSGLPIMLSTGMATLGEIEAALGVLAFGYLDPKSVPKRQDFIRAYCSDEGQRKLKQCVSILQCGTNYPLPPNEVNLRVMDAYRNGFQLAVGLSDHSSGCEIPIAAVAMGATVIEKHFTMDKDLPGPDHKASVDPKELTYMVSGIRKVELALGSGVKTLSQAEIENRKIVRKSIVAKRDLKIGQVIGVDDITSKRAGGGISPMYHWDIIGKVASRSYQADELIEEK
jgi:N-acetylneuraminate synthase